LVRTLIQVQAPLVVVAQAQQVVLQVPAWYMDLAAVALEEI
jgi:hypothetical protein